MQLVLAFAVTGPFQNKGPFPFLSVVTNMPSLPLAAI